MNKIRIRKPPKGLPRRIMARYEICKCWECCKNIGWIKIIAECSDTHGHPVLCKQCGEKTLLPPRVNISAPDYEWRSAKETRINAK